MGQMSWRAQFGADHKTLHVRHTPHDRWLPAHSVPGLSAPASMFSSSDFRTFQKLKSQGWDLLDQEGKVVV